MTWSRRESELNLWGLSVIVVDDEPCVVGYDSKGLWLVRPQANFARELIRKGTEDHAREGMSFFGKAAVARGGDGRLHVAYDHGKYPNAEIGLATRTDGVWKSTTLIKQSAAIGRTSEPHIAVAAAPDGTVTVAAGVLDDDRALVLLQPGKEPRQLAPHVDGVALACGADADVHLLCTIESRLHHARASTGWQLEEVPNTTSTPHVAIAIDPGGAPHIAFLDASKRKNALMYGVRANDTWQITQVDRELNSGWNPAIAFASTGRPVIGHWASKSPYNAGSSAIVDTPVRYVQQGDDGRWNAETVGVAFERSAFALAPDGTAWFAFARDESELEVVFGSATDPAVVPAKAKKSAAAKPRPSAKSRG